MRAIIAGAGIGGLTAALCLHRRGIHVDLFEQADTVRELGVGFNILPPAVAVLAELGLLEDLDRAGIRNGTLVMTNRRGQAILTDRRGLDAGWSIPQFSIHRGRLQRILADAVHARAGDVVHVDHRVERFEHDEHGVRVHVVSRCGVSRGFVHADILVGADGIRSAVRAQLVPREGEPLWNGSMMWRGATEWPAFLDGRTMIVAGGNDAKLVVYPIGPGGATATRLTNWGIVGTVAPAGRPPPPPASHHDAWSQPGRRSDLAPHLARFTSDVLNIKALVAATSPVLEYPLCDREPLPRWSHGRVTLLGDAAHPMYPMGSNGATQAIIDAADLGPARHARRHPGPASLRGEPAQPDQPTGAAEPPGWPRARHRPRRAPRTGWLRRHRRRHRARRAAANRRRLRLRCDADHHPAGLRSVTATQRQPHRTAGPSLKILAVYV